MNYEKLSVKQFILESKAGNIDLQDFYEKLFIELKRLDKKFNLLITISKPENLTNKGKLASLPISVKDCICTKGLQSTAGSKILESYIPPFDATCVKKIKEESGVITGKTAQDEFGFGTFSVNCAYKIPKNPLSPDRSCGGSSGGAAGLVKALNFPHIALAESTGGSISCPASFCGVVGLTPTYGLVSRYGLIDFANSLDKIGCIGKSSWDVALMLSVIAHWDEKDSTSIKKRPENYLKYLSSSGSLKGIKIGVPKEYFEGVDEKITNKIWQGIKKLESLGANYLEISLPYTKYSLAAYYIIATAEASTNLAKFCGMRYGKGESIEGEFNEYFSNVRTEYFGEEAKRRILLGTFARMAGFREQYYLKAMQVRSLIIQEFKKAFKKFDCLITPTMPILPPKFSEIKKLTPIQHYMMDILTVAPNLAGIPHLSLPCGCVNNLPVGIHILGNYLQEGKILRVGNEIEEKN